MQLQQAAVRACDNNYCNKLISAHLLIYSPAQPLGAFLAHLSTLAELFHLAPQHLGSPDVFLTFCSGSSISLIVRDLLVTIFHHLGQLYFLVPGGPLFLTFFGGMMTAPVMSIHTAALLIHADACKAEVVPVRAGKQLVGWKGSALF